MCSEMTEKMLPSSYLKPELFATEFDNLSTSKFALVQYDKGLAIGNKATYVFIACNGTWGSYNKDGSITTSYERIGYHGRTSDLLRGFLDSGAPIRVYRYSEFGGNNSNDGMVIKG